jgi:hypothetical protein
MAPTITIEAPGDRTSFRSAESKRAGLARIDMLSKLFDTAFTLPGSNVRFGVEALMRLVPGIGDAAASALSCYLLYEAHRLEVPQQVFARLVANVAIEGIVGAVPVLGDLFDVGFRANRRNVAILKEHFEREGLL